MSINLTVTESVTQLTLTLTEEQNVITVNPTVNVSSTGLDESAINTLAKLNALVADATLIDTTDSRLSDARTPISHTHTASQITDFDTKVSNNSAVAANTNKVGITTQQANDITSNNNKVSYTDASQVSTNTSKLSGIEAGAEVNTINSTTVGEPTGADVVLNVVSLLQAEYDAGTPVATTFYIITDA